MRYLGGKTRLAKAIGGVIRERGEGCSAYVEPFLGSAAILAEVADHFETAIAADLMPDVVELWRAARDGWVPPESLTLEEYEALRDAEPSALRGFAGFSCSFSGKFFGGYARDPKSDRNFARTGSRSIVRRAARFPRAEIVQADYRDLSPLVGPGVVVYADPPYRGTTGYSTGAFDHGDFWATMRAWRDAGAVVLVSEFSAPGDWTSVWQVERHTSTARDNRGARAVDHVYA